MEDKMSNFFRNMLAKQVATSDVTEAIRLINESLNTGEPEKYWINLKEEHLPLTCALLKQGILEVAIDLFNPSGIIYCPVKQYMDEASCDKREEAMGELKQATRTYLPDEYTPVDEQIALVAESIGESFDVAKIPTLVALMKEDVLRCNSVMLHDGKKRTEADNERIQTAKKEYASCKVDEDSIENAIEELISILETGKIKGEDEQC